MSLGDPEATSMELLGRNILANETPTETRPLLFVEMSLEKVTNHTRK
jgi:hypothetical protein